MSESPLLCIQNLSKSYRKGGAFGRDRVQALKDVSFDIARGEAVALVGESGSGKSTVARLVALLEPADSGCIDLNGEKVLGLRRTPLAYRKRVQMIFQDPFGSLNPVLSVKSHIERPLMLHQPKQRATIDEDVLKLLSRVGLSPAEDFVNKFPHSLSGGQRQRVAIARALAPKPQLLLADEPTSMLDVSIRAGILNLLKELKNEGISIMYITHDLSSARYLADRIVVMYRGEIVETGDAAKVLDHPSHPYTKLLIAAVPDPDKSILEPLPSREDFDLGKDDEK
jgi:peptide/nickel transport system ATP-binding protein